MIRTMRRFMHEPALSSFVGAEISPGSDAETDDEILAAFKPLVSAGLHATGTCRMGPPGRGVLDSRLRVHGLSGIRVVDCSAMPTAISGNTHAPAMALAWRAAELIMDDGNACADAKHKEAPDDISIH
jgi:choline dehydrogenase